MDPRVLIADNDRNVSLLLKEVLRRQGCGVETAFDGKEAIEAIERGAFRVLVCDIDMPKASGFEVIQRAARMPTPPRTLVISGFVDAAIEQQLLAFPCVHRVLKKPFDLMQFAALVCELAAGAPEAPAAATPLRCEDGG